VAVAEKKAYELKANVNDTSEIAVGDRLLSLKDGETYTTSDVMEQGALDGWDAVKEVPVPGTRKAGS
jgi:hypothetical protein